MEIHVGFYKDLLVSALFMVVNVTPTETRNKSRSTKQVTLKAFDCIVQCCIKSICTLTLINEKKNLNINAKNTIKAFKRNCFINTWF